MDTKTGKANLEITPDRDAVSSRVLDVFLKKAQESIEKRGFFTVAISGGKTHCQFFELLGQSPQAKKIDWSKVHFFWVDETIPSDKCKGKNYTLAAETFLKSLNIPQENIHRIHTEHADCQQAAKMYEQEIRDIFKIEDSKTPEFDLVMLGMDTKGCCGSLFTDSYAAYDQEDIACVVYDLHEMNNRITLTRAVLCAARSLIVTVSGEHKAKVLSEVLNSEPDEVRFPIHILWPVLDKVHWLIDAQAAKHII